MATTSGETESRFPISQMLISTTGFEGVADLFPTTTQASFLIGKTQLHSLTIFPDVQKFIIKVLSNVQVAMCIFGVISNIINIFVFYKIGFGDSVTVVLFGLSISDLCYLFCSLVSQTLDTLDGTVGLRPFEPLKHLAFQVAWSCGLFYDTGVIITVFNAVQKCACVAIPLVFTSVFTKWRCVVIVCFIYAAMLLYFLPAFANPGKQTYFDYTVNWTRLGNYYLPNNASLPIIYSIFSRFLLPFVSQAVVLFCMVILAVKLRATLKFRRTMRLSREFSELNDNEKDQNKEKRSWKEIRAIQTVALLSAMFVFCNLPDILITLTRWLYPEFSDSNSRLQSTYHMCFAINDLFAVTNSAVNIVVYVNYNNKYRRGFKEIVRAIVCRSTNPSL